MKTSLGKGKTPLSMVQEWLDFAKSKNIQDHNAIALATSDPEGIPNVRMVLLKEIDTNGFIFYTNYTSTKGSEISHRSNVAFSLHWRSLKRQIRVKGMAEILEPEKSDEYFHSRQLDSRYGAWASKQSRELPSKKLLVNSVARIAMKFGNSPPRPEFWGGYRIIPSEIEFWSEGKFRIHDRIRWIRNRQNSKWESIRLYP